MQQLILPSAWFAILPEAARGPPLGIPVAPVVHELLEFGHRDRVATYLVSVQFHLVRRRLI
jgi:hypothetical protein